MAAALPSKMHSLVKKSISRTTSIRIFEFRAFAFTNNEVYEKNNEVYETHGFKIANKLSSRLKVNC